MQQQLTFLEKKIDKLISSQAQAAQNQSQRPSHQSFDRPGNRYQAICADCGEECELPFRPSGDRPVYCRACFSKRKSGDSRNNDSRSSGGRNQRFDERKRPNFRKRKGRE
ncbi:MAG: hypothetical protein JW946_00640 [Candidatus Omnitrophica bacterium]|nr:hypothetical protein [Candidatus Omnitrophota bacterium]